MSVKRLQRFYALARKGLAAVLALAVLLAGSPAVYAGQNQDALAPRSGFSKDALEALLEEVRNAPDMYALPATQGKIKDIKIPPNQTLHRVFDSLEKEQQGLARANLAYVVKMLMSWEAVTIGQTEFDRLVKALRHPLSDRLEGLSDKARTEFFYIHSALEDILVRKDASFKLKPEHVRPLYQSAEWEITTGNFFTRVPEYLSRELPGIGAMTLVPEDFVGIISDLQTEEHAGRLGPIKSYWCEVLGLAAAADRSLLGRLQEALAKSQYPLTHKHLAYALGIAAQKNPDCFKQIENSLAQDIGLFQLSLKTAGSAVETSASFTKGLLCGIPEAPVLNAPGETPKLQPIDAAKDIAQADSLQALFPDLTFVRAVGRTLVFEAKDGTYVGIKFLRQGEDVALLDYEHRWFDYLDANKDSLSLQGKYPRGLAFENKRAMRVRDIGAKGEAALTALLRHPDGKIRVDRTGEQYTLMAYKVDDLAYFQELDDPALSHEEFMRASKIVLNDLFALARHGIIHTAPIDLFHNPHGTQRPEDNGGFIPMAEIFARTRPDLGVGRVHAWTKSVKHKNLRVSGLADFAEIRTLEELLDDANPLSVHLRGLRSHGDMFRKDVFYLANSLADDVVSWGFTLANYLREREELDWKAPGDLAAMLKEGLEAAFHGFLQENAGASTTLAGKSIDWERLAKQMAFYMAKDTPYVREQLGLEILTQIYGLEGTRLEAMPPLTDGDSLRHEPDLPGWRQDRVNEDLGPFNGPFPIQEMVKAFHLYPALMIQAADAGDAAAGIGQQSTGDGFIQSERGQAQEALARMREQGRNALQHAVLSDFEAMKKFIEKKLDAFENAVGQDSRSVRKDFLTKCLNAVKEGYARFKKIYESGQMYSFQGIVHGTEDFALGYGNDKEIGVAMELLVLPAELQAELFLHEAMCFKEGHWNAKSILREVFKGDGDNKLGVALRDLIDKKARMQDGVDIFDQFKEILDSRPDVHPIYIDEGLCSQNALKKAVGKLPADTKTILFAGRMDYIRYLLHVSRPEEKEILDSKFKVLITKNAGVVGVGGITAEVNTKIKALVPSEEPVLLDLRVALVLLKAYALGYPAALDMLENVIHGKSATCPHAQLEEIFLTFARHSKAPKRKKASEDWKNHEKSLEESNTIAAMIGLMPVDIMKEFMRRIILEDRIKSHDFIAMLDKLLTEENRFRGDRRQTQWLWELYLDPGNTAEENTSLRDFLITVLVEDRGRESSALSSIRRIFSAGDAAQAQKAMDVLLRLPVSKDQMDYLFELLEVAKVRKGVLAAYCLLNTTLFGPQEMVASHGAIFNQDNPVTDLLKPSSRSIYFYLRKMQEARKQSGAGKYHVDLRVQNASIALDNYAGVPGRDGISWFTHLRSRIHTQASSSDLKVVRKALWYWRTLDARVLEEKWDELPRAVTRLGHKRTERYSTLLNRAIKTMQSAGKIRDLPEDGFLDEMKKVPEDEIMEALEKASGEKSSQAQDALKKVQEMIKLFLALTERYEVLGSSIIPNIKGEVGRVKEEKIWNAKLMKELTQFMTADYRALLKAIDSGDQSAMLKAIPQCRLQIRNHLLLDKIASSNVQPDERKEEGVTVFESGDREDYDKDELMDLDFNLSLLGKEVLVRALEGVNKAQHPEDLRLSIDSLITMGKFILASGLGGTEFEQLIEELESGTLKYSQLHDLIRALRMEAHKIPRKINEEMRFAMEHIWENVDYYDLAERWQDRVKTRKTKDRFDASRQIITDESRAMVEAAIVDELIVDTGILVFDDALMKFDKILETKLDPTKDDVILRESATASMANDRRKSSVQKDRSFAHAQDDRGSVLSDQFFRFGQPDVIPRPKLLSLWSKKGLNLVKMTEEGMPVPPGVIISATLVTDPKTVHSQPFETAVQKEIDLIRKHSQYPDLKFLLYARSGSAFTLPGLLTTIPNMGMNDEEARTLAEKTGDTWFAYDTYAEFIRAFSIDILGIPEKYFQEALNIYEKDSLTGDEMMQVVERYKDIVRKHGLEVILREQGDRRISPGQKDRSFASLRMTKNKDDIFHKIIPKKMIDQVMMAIDAVYASWDSDEARKYRARHRISQEWGSVVILQKGVFGNIPEKNGQLSGTGHAALRALPDGSEVAQGKFRIRGMGHDLMSRAMNYIVLSNSQRNPDAIVKERTLEDEYPEMYRAVLEYAQKLKEIFGNNQEFEFTVELGKLWITQSNDDYVTVDYPEFVDAESNVVLARGKGVSGGAFRGWVANSIPKAQQLLEKFHREKPADIDGVILFLDRVNPEMINMLPAGIALCAKLISVHAETLAQRSGMTAMYGVEAMEYSVPEQCWTIGSHAMRDGVVISMDGHENQLVYHNSGKIFLGTVPIADKEDGKTELERRSTCALGRIGELKALEQADAARQEAQFVLTEFETEILKRFEAFMNGKTTWDKISRYRLRYRALLDRIARFCEALDFSLYGKQFKDALVARLAQRGISFELFDALAKRMHSRDAKYQELLDRIASRLHHKPPAESLPATIKAFDKDGNAISLKVEDLMSDRIPQSKVAILHPLRSELQLVSIDYDEVLEWLSPDECVEIFARLKALGYVTAITTTNPNIPHWVASLPELQKYVDHVQHDSWRISLKFYEKELGIPKNQIIHFGRGYGGGFIDPNPAVTLHRQGFVSVGVGRRYLIPTEEMVEGEMDAVLFEGAGMEDMLDIVNSARKTFLRHGHDAGTIDAFMQNPLESAA